MSTIFHLPTVIPERPRAGRAALRRLALLATRAVRYGINAWMVRQCINELQSLDDRVLADIGLTRSEIESAVRWRTAPEWLP